LHIQRLREKLTAEGLDRVVEELIALAAPTIRLYAQEADEEAIPTGASKLGGCPDLPAGTTWPAWHEPMAFIGQINLADLAPVDLDGTLPHDGLLSFFFETNGEPLYAARWGLPDDAPYLDDYGVIDLSPSWRVLHHPADPATFLRRALPEALNESARYMPGSVRFAAEVTLPAVDGPELWPLQLTTHERAAFIHLEHEVNWGERWQDGGHHLLGYAYDLGVPTLVACDEEARGAAGGWAHADAARRREIERDASRRWRLLLQLSSSDVTGMDWAGGGVLHCCIERDALPARDFSRARMALHFL